MALDLTAPFKLFETYYAEAIKAGHTDPEAVFLATATRDAKPSGRVVLYRGISPEGAHEGFYFYTNYTSRKGQELDQNPHAALTFFWNKTGRQIRIEGKVTRVADKLSDEYWATRPRGSQLSGAVSPQSQKIHDLETLRTEKLKLEKECDNKPVPRPKDWGGFCLEPTHIEFWKMGDDRFHERVIYERTPTGWQTSLLAP